MKPLEVNETFEEFKMSCRYGFKVINFGTVSESQTCSEVNNKRMCHHKERIIGLSKTSCLKRNCPRLKGRGE